MTAATTAVPYSEYVGKKVIVKVTNPDTGEEKEKSGTIYSTAPQGILLIPKGKSSGDLIFNHEITEIELNEPDTGFKARKVPLVALDKMRQHLLDRHGLTVKYVETLSEQQAAEMHDNLHNANVLGHYHEASSSGKK